MFALLLLVRQFSKGNAKQQAAIYRLYLDNTQRINNWDLVDSSASQIVGNYLASRDRKILYKLARSSSMWERRIAIISTFQFILLMYLYSSNYADKTSSLGEGLRLTLKEVEQKGLDILPPWKTGELALPRLHEVAAAINRVRA